MRVLVVQRGKQPYVSDIDDTLKAKQQIVGGPIDILSLWDDSAVIVLNDEGKNMGYENNRMVGRIEIAGTFFVCREDNAGNLLSLSAEQIDKYMQLFSLS